MFENIEEIINNNNIIILHIEKNSQVVNHKEKSLSQKFY